MSPPSTNSIVQPHEHDVLSGRGNFVNYHAGNEYFRNLVRKHKVAYVACPKPQKGKFSKLIVDEIKARDPPGRFLKQDETTKLWYDIGEKKALDKTRQALREGAPVIMKGLGGEDEEAGSSSKETNPAPAPSPQQLPPSNVLGTSPNHSNGFLLNNVVSQQQHQQPPQQQQQQQQQQPQQMLFNDFNVQNNTFNGVNSMGCQTMPHMNNNQIQRGVMSHSSMPYNGLATLQQQQQLLQQSQQMRMINRNNSAPPTGLNLQSQMNHHGVQNIQHQIGNLMSFQQKMSGPAHQSTLYPEVVLEPTPLRPNSNLSIQPQHEQPLQAPPSPDKQSNAELFFGEQKDLPQLPPRRMPMRGYSRRGLQREESDRGIMRGLSRRSLMQREESDRGMMRGISRRNLGREESDRSLILDTDTLFTRTGLDFSDHKRNGSSTYNMSIMSLSSDEQPPGLDITQDPNDMLGSMFSNSMCLSDRRLGGKRPTRAGSEDVDTVQNVMQMSVATLNDPFGGSSGIQLNESQDEISFVNVFEDQGDVLFVNQAAR